MKFIYNLSKEDFLVYQLYSASISPYVKRARRINWLVVPVLYLIFALVLYFTGDISFTVGFVLLAFIWLIFYPFFQKSRYKKGYEKQNSEFFKNRFDKPVEVNFTKMYVTSKDQSGEGKMKLSEMEKINETKDYYFLKFNSGVSLIIPKQKIAELEQLKELLEKLAGELNIEHVVDLEWKWR